MPFTTLTFLEARNELAGRLGDTNKTFWTDAELSLYVKEALRQYNSLAGVFRQRGIITVPAGTRFREVRGDLTNSGGYPLRPSRTDRELINLAQYMLIEAPTTSWPAASLTTSQFSFPRLVSLLSWKHNETLFKSGVFVEDITLGIPGGAGRLVTSSDIQDIRRMTWELPGSSPVLLWRSDEGMANTWLPAWREPLTDSPSFWSVVSTPRLEVQVFPIPGTTGTIQALVIRAGSDFNPTSLATTLLVPDDLASTVLYGALADLLSRDGEALDTVRAQYCSQRFTQGLMLLSAWSPILNVFLSGDDQLTVSPLADLDRYNPSWQSNSSGTPEQALLAGPTLLRLDPTPAQDVSLEIDVIRNAVLPSADGDYLQLDEHHIAATLDLAHHLAMFKVGGAEFIATGELFRRVINSAALWNDRLAASVAKFGIFQQKIATEKARRPQFNSDADQSGKGERNAQ